MKEHYQRMIAYNAWANSRFLNCLEKNTVANGKVFLLMSHLLTAEEIWHCRLLAKPAPTQNLWKEQPLKLLQQKAQDQQKAWSEYLEATEVQAFGEEVEYTNSKGELFRTSVADILNHTFNHGTYHRGQMANLLKLEGVEPPASDYIVYVRQSGKDQHNY